LDPVSTRHGEPRLDSSGLGTIYDAADDLPTGDGLAGGEAVFYVGSLRGDVGGYFYGPPDGIVDYWDLLVYTNVYNAGSLDADFGGYFYGPPDKAIDYWDLLTFTPIYQQTEGMSLAPLPTEGTLSSGDPVPLALETAGETTLAGSDPALVLPDEATTAATGEAALTDETLLAGATAAGTLATDTGAALAADPTTATALAPAPTTPTPDLWTPDTGAEDAAGTTALDPADALAGPALDVAL
jgi:hypothetical protein